MHTCHWDGGDDDTIHVTWIGGIRGYSYGDHDHRGFWELTWVGRGTLDHQLGGIWTRQTIGTATIVREGEVHALRGSGVEYANVSFTAAFARALSPALAGALATPGPLVARLAAGRRIAFDEDLEALAATRGDPPRQAALLTQLLCTVVQRALAERAAAPEGPAWLARLRERVDDTTAPVPDLRTLRRLAEVAPEHLARTIRRHLGCTPSRWLHQVRLQRAARLLAAGNAPIAEVGARCGYADPGLFHRRFAEHYGLGPRAWRTRQQRFVR